MTTATTTFTPRPTIRSSVIAFAAGVIAIGFVADVTIQRRLLYLSVLGIVAFSGGILAWREDLQTVGSAALIGGTTIMMLTLWLVTAWPMLTVHRFELFPGLLGLWILAAGLVSLRDGWERRLAAIGTSLIVLAVLMSGVVQTSGVTALLIGGALAIYTWDQAEHAISLGGHVGVDADTSRAEFVHAGASLLVAACAVLVVAIIYHLGVDDLSFAALATLLVAGIVLALGHYR